MKFSPASSKRRFSFRGFSLPEVTIAVGITALGIVAILGLLPQGYDMALKTAQMTAETRIVQQITGEFNTGTWIQMDTVSPRNRWYNDQGLEVDDRTDLGISYVVNVAVPTSDMRLPGAEQSAAPEGALRRVTIKIASSTNPDYAFADPKRFSTVTTLIAKTN